MSWVMYQSDGITDTPPVSGDTPIAVMMLDGEVWDDGLADEYNWAVVDEAGEIIAYKILPKNTAEKYRTEKVFA